MNDVRLDAKMVRGRVRRLLASRWFKVAVILLLIASPVLFYLTYYGVANIPFDVRFAVGRQGGRHAPVMQALIDRLERDAVAAASDELQLRISRRPVRGSLDAYRGLQFGEFDFAFYQAGTAKQLNPIEFYELDNFTSPPSVRRGDGTLSFSELQWRRPASEAAEVQRRATESTLRALGKDADSVVSYAEFASSSRIRFVANVFSEVVHFIVPADSEITSIYDLHPQTQDDRKAVAIGDAFSGEFAMSLVILEAFGLATRPPTDTPASITDWQFDIQPFELASQQVDEQPQTSISTDYQQYLARVEQGFTDGTLDAALITMGVDANSQMARFLGSGRFRLLPIPQLGMLKKKNVQVSEFVIPAGMYRAVSPSDTSEAGSHSVLGMVPSHDVSTASVRCKLLARDDVSPRVVAAVTRQLLKEDFQAGQSLDELFELDRESRIKFAQDKPEFPIHPGALSVYHPEEFDLGQFEAWDAIYSLIASLVIATFFSVRWFYRRRERKREHRLDRWIHSLLDIEQRQLELDTGPGMHHEAELQALLDEISHLRTHVLGKCSAHELKEDPSGQYFVEMSHSLTNKINAKLSRQRMDARFDDLIRVIKGAQADES